MARVAVLGSLPESLINFRGPLLKAMVDAGHEVHALAPPADSHLIAQLSALGVRYHAVPLARTSLNPLQDLRSLLFLRSLFRSIRPNCLLAYTIKPVIYGCLAARWAGVYRCYPMITGLGYTFTATGLRGCIVGTVARGLYRLALRGSARVFFQNPDDMQLFLKLRLVARPEQAVLINGTGVDLEHFAPVALPKIPSFLMIARLLRDKGVVEYVEAARMVKAEYPQARFLLVGWIDENPAAISQKDLDGWIREGVIEYLGRLEDVRSAIASCNVYVLPSYHEGMPRTVLEAMAMSRPIITTDRPGCRETVVDGENGFLVPAKNAAALAEAMVRFIESSDQVSVMGSASRRIAESRFDVREVNTVILRTMGLA